MKSNNFLPLNKRKRAAENSKHMLISWKCWAMIHKHFNGDLNEIKAWFETEIDVLGASPTMMLQRYEGEQLLKYIKYTYFKEEK